MVLEPNKYGPLRLPIPPLNHHELARYPEHDFDYNAVQSLPQVPGLPYPCPNYRNLRETDNGAHILGDHFKGLYIPLVLALSIRTRLERTLAEKLAKSGQMGHVALRNVLQIDSDSDLDVMGVNLPELNRRIASFWNQNVGRQKRQSQYRGRDSVESSVSDRVSTLKPRVINLAKIDANAVVVTITTAIVVLAIVVLVL